MAAPHMAGVSVLVKQYVNENFPSLSKSEAHRLVENIMMGTAQPIVDPEGEYYPVYAQRVGLADIGGALNTDVIVYSEANNRAKIELFDQLDSNQIEASFIVKSLANEKRNFDLTS